MSSLAAKSRITALTLAAIGVVYGDIGTSPLYTMKEVFSPVHGLALNEANVQGVVSLILWGLTLVVSLKYVALIMRADNRGEGGIMALSALAMASVGRNSHWWRPLMLTGLLGAALFYGDGVITPAISVLSAMEGLEVAAPALSKWVIPLTVLTLVCLYSVQHLGTGGVGRWFGPIMTLWFAVLAGMGLVNIAAHPEILAAINPLHGLRFLLSHGWWAALLTLGSVFLAFTGAEALYADMGHFGKQPIRIAWYAVVFPALGLNYLGQGAVLLANPAAVEHPFYHQLGDWSVIPLVALSTVATVIASQATISATFSITQQAISLGFLPRMQVRHTSESQMGQVYMPLVNWAQLTAVLLAVVGFGSSDGLASAYGIAVTMTMVTTTFLTFFVVRFGWRYNVWLALGATAFFLVVDLSFFTANLLKIAHGGWFPLALGALVMTVLLTWRRGRELVFENLQSHMIPLQEFLQTLFVDPPLRVPGVAVFFRAEGDGVPHAMLHNLLHNKVLHERIVFLTVHNQEIPHVPLEQGIALQSLGHDCWQLDLSYGFKDERDIPRALAACAERGLQLEMMQVSFFVARQTVVPTVGSGMALWREGLFATMSRQARDAADYFKVPPNRVIELGTQIEI